MRQPYFKHAILFSILHFLLTTSLAQTDTAVVVEVDKPGTRIHHKLHNERFKSLAEAEKEVKNHAFHEGFIAYQSTHDTLNGTLRVACGEVFRWAEINMDEETERVVRKSGLNSKRFKRKPISPQRIGRVMNAMITELENNGRPFAEVRLDSVNIEGSRIFATLAMSEGPLVHIDSVIIVGDLRVRETYLTNYLGIKEGGLYNESRIRAISQSLAEVPFLSEVRPPEVLFHKEETRLTLFLNAQRASRFDGIVGFLPDEKTGAVLITGDAALHLENALKNGETIDLNWRRLQTNTQDLYAETVIPFVLNSPISPDGVLKIYRRDTLFSDLFTQLGVRYIFSRNNYVRVFADRQATSLISTDQYEATTVIPPYLDRTVRSYGIGFRFSKMDYLLNPARGVEFFAESGVGNKVIERNAALPAFIYDSLNLNTLQTKARLNAAYYLSIVPRLVWHQRFMGASLFNDQLFNNEAYRIGGLKTLRGFNEEAFFATSYAIARNELRYQIERNGYVFLLFDQAWYENTAINRIGVRRDTPYAFGAGITLGTKAGIFSFSGALGSEQGNPILVRAAKFHFGFLSVF